MKKKRAEHAENEKQILPAPPRSEQSNLGEMTYEEKYAVYRVWKSLPITMLRKLTRDEIYTNVGIDDPDVLDLTEIHTQGEFGNKYGVHIDTLTDWNKKIYGENPFDEARVWSQHLVKNLILSLYAKAVKTADPFRIELFFKAVNKWEEKVRVDVNYKGVTSFNIQPLTPEKIAALKATGKVEPAAIAKPLPVENKNVGTKTAVVG